uniref:Uncharacterized protein n=1 Tax=Romanomermis culicivorax TaxID=13658 RepID=A0A915JP23_ROMCU
MNIVGDSRPLYEMNRHFAENPIEKGKNRRIFVADNRRQSATALLNWAFQAHRKTMVLNIK